MKLLSEKKTKICIAILILLIIAAGIVVTITWGFNKELKYQENQSIDVYIEQEFDISKIKEIENEILGKRNIVQTVEIYGDMVTIRAKTISEEQKNDIVNKIKENYEFKQTAEETTVDTISELRIRDMYKKYVMPFAISSAVILLYMLIRYYKKGILKVLLTTVCIPVVAELLCISIIAITRIPVGRFIPIILIVIYIATILYAVKKCEE